MDLVYERQINCPNCKAQYELTVREPPIQRYDDGTHYCPMCGASGSFDPQES